MNANLLALRQKAITLPLLPGVYLMKDSKGGILYIGKAKQLKNRVTQYFGNGFHDAYDMAMVEKVRDFDYIVVGSEHEALVLECALIKQHAPKYNILLKDDKGYRWVKITREAWPRLLVAKQKHDDGAEYLGPYTNAYAVKLAVEEAQQIFKLPTCSRVFPRDIGRGRPCLQYHMQRCGAPCGRKILQEAYAQSVREATNFLKKGSAQGEKELRHAMEQAAEDLEFERAARLRDRLRALEKLKEKQHVMSQSTERQDVFALTTAQNQACWMVLRFAGGRLRDAEHFLLLRGDFRALLLEDTAGEPALRQARQSMRQELLERYYAMRNEDLPRRVLLDGDIEARDLLEDWLGGMAGRKVAVQTAQKGEPLRLVELCRQNALEKLAHHTGRQSKTIAALEELARMLGLPRAPAYIEAYDISHTGGSDNVAGMVVFAQGLPLKKAYKRFAIKGFSGQDDYASMAEVLERRMARYEEEKDTGDEFGFGRLPDLILLDGGMGQVHAVEPVLRRHGHALPLFGMVKDSKHKTRAITSGGGEIALTSTKAAFALVTTIQDEAHRFAIAYHHKKHTKAALDSELLKIPGIGPAKAKALLTHFQTMQAIREALPEALAQAPGMNEKTAQAVREYFLSTNTFS